MNPTTQQQKSKHVKNKLVIYGIFVPSAMLSCVEKSIKNEANILQKTALEKVRKNDWKSEENQQNLFQKSIRKASKKVIDFLTIFDSFWKPKSSPNLSKNNEKSIQKQSPQNDEKTEPRPAPGLAVRLGSAALRILKSNFPWGPGAPGPAGQQGQQASRATGSAGQAYCP